MSAHLKLHSHVRQIPAGRDASVSRALRGSGSTASSSKPLVSSIMPSSAFPYGKKCKKRRKQPQQDGKHGQKCRYRQRRGRCLLHGCAENRGNEVRFRLWIRCDTADNGVRAKNNPTISAETICIPDSIAPACAEPNTPRPPSPMQKPGLAQLQNRFTRSAASRESIPSSSSAHAVAAPTGYPPMSPSTSAGAASAAGRISGQAALPSAATAARVSQRTSSPLTTKNGNKAGKACAAARESPSRTPSAQAVGQSKNAAKEPAIRTAS